MILKIYRNFLLYGLLLFCTSLSSCGVYSFSGTSLPPDVQTFSVQSFVNNATEGPSGLSLQVTENFKRYFQQNTSLRLVPNNGHLQLQGQISGLSITPVGVERQASGVEQATQNRLTITMQIDYINEKDPEQNFNRTFTAYEDFSQNLDFTQLPPAFYDRIINRIVLDVFNATAANW